MKNMARYLQYTFAVPGSPVGTKNIFSKGYIKMFNFKSIINTRMAQNSRVVSINQIVADESGAKDLMVSEKAVSKSRKVISQAMEIVTGIDEKAGITMQEFVSTLTTKLSDTDNLKDNDAVEKAVLAAKSQIASNDNMVITA